LALGVIVTKGLLITGVALAFRVRPMRAAWLGLLLSQGGEFGFVLFGQAAGGGLISTENSALLTAVVTISMLSTPFLMHLLNWLNRAMPGEDVNLEGPEVSPETNAIVVGYGRFGQTVAQMLMAKRIPVTIIDSKPEQIEMSEEFGTKVYYGDGTRLDLLRTAGGEEAEGIFFCQDEPMERSRLEAVLEAFPQAQVMVRVYDRRQLIDYDGLDVALFQRELFESAVVMGREGLRALGVPRREVRRVEEEYRVRDDERLEAQSKTGDLHAAKETIFTADRPLRDAEPAEARPGVSNNPLSH
jgi:voltage-gated potassium channel Kch